MTKSNGSGEAACCGAQAVRLGNKVRDPLCGAAVDVASPHRLEHDGRSLRFCSEDCRDAYAKALEGDLVPGVAFACPMHPEMRQDEPGDCPLCSATMGPVRLAPPVRPGGLGALLGKLRTAFGA